MDALFHEIGIYLEAAGIWSYLLAPALTTAVAILPVPAEFPAILNGMVFGPWAGSLITWVGALAGAQASFELSRRLGRPAAERLIRDSALRKADRVALAVDWWGLLAPRLVPLVAFTALNWGAGLTPVSRWRFFWTTGVGIVPGVILFTATGAGLPALVRQLPWIAGVLGSGVILWGLVSLRARRRGRPRDPSRP